jgi:hypothetical protein
MADSTDLDPGATGAGGGPRRDVPIAAPGGPTEPSNDPGIGIGDAEVDVAAFERAEAELDAATIRPEDAREPLEADERSATGEGPASADVGAADRSEGGVCPIGFCPIGMALSVVQGTKPDAVAHLLVASREFLLAARSVLDARVEAGGGSSTLKKIEID